jgi:hypothetical protein
VKQKIDKFPPDDFRNYAEDMIPEANGGNNNNASAAPQPQDLDKMMEANA